MPVMELKTADTFTFAMFAIKVFTGNIPFAYHKKADGRCWRTPRRWGLPMTCGCSSRVVFTRTPTNDLVWEVLKRWREFVENGDGDGAVECVQAIPVVLTASSAQSSTLIVDLGIHPGRFS